MFLDRVANSPTLQMVNLVLQKQAAGERIVSLAIGEPSFNTPREIVDVAYEAMKAGEVHYTSSYGTAEVRGAIAKKVRKKNGINAEPANTIFLTTKFAVYASLMAVVRSGCEILMPDPGYFYSEPVILAGAKPRYYRLGADFSLNVDLIRKQINARTRAVIINTPSNPTARVFGRSELKELYDLCREKDVVIISDEAYEDLVYKGSHFSVGSLERKPSQVISLFSLSKSYAMTGWRAGYVVGSTRNVSRICKFLENTYTSYPPFIQKASAYALTNGDRFISGFHAELAKRKKLVEEGLEKIKGVEHYTADGASYLFPSYTARQKSIALSKRILQEQALAVLPGAAFGPHGERRLRISFAGAPETLEEGIDRLARFFSGLNP
ncbi:MAG: aminotransferase class I/II-fold pyridoxal phosphate-dependent enzyme [Nitrososphaerales archaeon]|nr:aminotransferase class I/II-fold pyridoxal phosphate-dependent enzyme [Nitrososphaerales archaeon]